VPPETDPDNAPAAARVSYVGFSREPDRREREKAQSLDGGHMMGGSMICSKQLY
jgi:hypothetical protein